MPYDNFLPENCEKRAFSVNNDEYSTAQASSVNNDLTTIKDDHEIDVHDSDIASPIISNESKRHRPIAFNKDLIVVPIMFLILFSLINGVVVGNDIMMAKCCASVLNYSSDICNNLTAYPFEYDSVQQVTKSYGLYGMLISLIPAIFVSILIGGWSDKYGRKIPLVVAVFGMTVNSVGVLLNVVYMEWHPIYNLLVALPGAIVGGTTTVTACIFSFVSDKYSSETRTLMYGAIEMAGGVATVSATFLSGQVYKHFGAIAVYCTTVAAYLLCFMLALLFMEDSIRTYEQSIKVMIKDLFSFKSLKNNLQVYTRKREGYERLQLSLLTISLAIALISYLAPMDVLIYYCKKVYSWDVPTYTNMYTVMMVVSIAVVIVATPILTKRYRVPDYTLGLVGSLSMLGQNLIFGVAFKEWIFYIAIAVGSFVNFTPFAIRSQLSKSINIDERGKVFAVAASCETLAPVVESFLSTGIYNPTINIFPGAIFLVIAALMIFPFSTFIWITYSQRIKKQEFCQRTKNKDSVEPLEI